MMENVTARSPNVRLHISIKDKKADDYTEIIRGTSKGYETVEIDGLVFRRKRMGSSESPGVVKRARRQENHLPSEGRLDGSQSPKAATPSQAGLALASSDTAVAATEEPGSENSDALRQSSPGPTEGAQATASSILSRLPAGASEAARMIAMCDALEDAEGTFAATFKTCVAAAIDDGTLVFHVPQAKNARPLMERQQREAALQKQLAMLHKEEDEWMNLLKEGTELAKGKLEIRDQMAHMEAQPQVEPQLKKLQQQSHKMLSCQVEGLSRIIANVEQLQGKAESQCRLMQVEYHKEKFLNFPHIDSPARLIHDIVRTRYI